MLMDGEASDLEVRRTIRALDEDAELLDKWRRYHLVRSVMQGDMRESGACEFARTDLSGRVSAALASEEAYSMERSPAPAARSWQERFIKPLSSIAVAASVSAVVVFGWQNFQQAQGTHPAQSAGGTLAQAYSQAPDAGSGFRTVAESQRQIQRNVMNQSDIIRMPSEQNRRLNQYLVSHSGNAALNTASGSMSYTRVVHIAP